MVAKLCVRLLFTASTAVIIAINAIIPKAIIITVMVVRSRLLFIVLYDNAMESLVFMPFKLI